jgi:glutathione S-transferase
MAQHGSNGLVLTAAHPDFVQYLYWSHFANGNLQPTMSRNLLLRRLNLPPDNAVVVATTDRLAISLSAVASRLEGASYLAGSSFTAADIMNVFSLSTMRSFLPVDLSPYPSIRAYLARIGSRDGYRRAMQAAEPGMAPLLA